ncbi:MAG: UDP-N-acetylmuramoyl-L-alanine--D-glutamate ligase [Anaerosomatales bacterium]|nr:UDP-N-acetylmuramoyl-L-alanine--D-glutamate ligase [Anaerosomatales bacterium]MDT8433247.1 UDP-N-acetylmuramoyl-L-alanine--D-glutamate ligase [Anaerosomatales bacterium]
MEQLHGDILVVGLGASGEAAATYCLQRAANGDPVTVTVIDSGDSDTLWARAQRLGELGASVHLGAAHVAGSYDLAIASPGIPPHAALMGEVREAAVEVISELEFAYRRSDASWLAVTGTNGKTTVTSLLGHLLQAAGVSATVVGNIGTPAISMVDEAGPAGALVAEVSSFQLALTRDFHPRVSVLLNITPDHLDWHGDLETYARDKARVFARQNGEDTAIIDRDDSGAALMIEEVRSQGVRVVEVSIGSIPAGGAGLAPDGTLTLDTVAGGLGLVHRDDLLIKGDHNVSNALAASAAAHAFGAPTDAIAAGLRTFEPIEHRLEPVGVLRGVEYFNDSKATNPDAALKALGALVERDVVMLLGGRNKGAHFGELGRAMARAGARAIVFGEAAEQIAGDLQASGVAFERAGRLPDAVRMAAALARPGGAVVLSPACASFDEFSGYAERGSVFRRLVCEMAEGEV